MVSYISFGAASLGAASPEERVGYVIGTLACPMLVGIVAVAGIVWAVWYYRR